VCFQARHCGSRSYLPLTVWSHSTAFTSSDRSPGERPFPKDITELSITHITLFKLNFKLFEIVRQANRRLPKPIFSSRDSFWALSLLLMMSPLCVTDLLLHLDMSYRCPLFLALHFTTRCMHAATGRRVKRDTKDSLWTPCLVWQTPPPHPPSLSLQPPLSPSLSLSFQLTPMAAVLVSHPQRYPHWIF